MASAVSAPTGVEDLVDLELQAVLASVRASHTSLACVLRPNYLLVDINVSLQVWRPFGALQLAVPIAVCVFSPVKSP
jgi:hypothetical protein